MAWDYFFAAPCIRQIILCITHCNIRTRKAVSTLICSFSRFCPNEAMALRSAAYPVESKRRQIFCTVLNFHSLYGYARIIYGLLLLLGIPVHAASAFAFSLHATPLYCVFYRKTLLNQNRVNYTST